MGRGGARVPAPRFRQQNANFDILIRCDQGRGRWAIDGHSAGDGFGPSVLVCDRRTERVADRRVEIGEWPAERSAQKGIRKPSLRPSRPSIVRPTEAIHPIAHPPPGAPVSTSLSLSLDARRALPRPRLRTSEHTPPTHPPLGRQPYTPRYVHTRHTNSYYNPAPDYRIRHSCVTPQKTSLFLSGDPPHVAPLPGPASSIARAVRRARSRVGCQLDWDL
ncbi:hypothetical protein BS50DRAFT_569903 [Corynespora cassiicola Philippines]|uniref:Uncharacterized protein n=1 Tax=Corynespora cassiicola Philippines TaxID=1448308 RepID=A0A2T2P443_CORCC|nr:hypothetical protein BS50DRAFT_569903 [Corynespora cassiicola Philippines]